MMSSHSDGILIDLDDIPSENSSNLVWVNEHEIAVAQSDAAEEEDDEYEYGIWIYNILTNEWRIHIKYPEEECITDAEICYDPITKILWLYSDGETADVGQIFKFDMESKQFEKIIESEEVGFGIWPKLILIDNKLHIIGGSRNKYHLIWDNDQKKLETIYSFPVLTEGFYGHNIVYAENKRFIYLFGGFDGENSYIDEIWKCEIDKNYQWTKLKDELDEFYRKAAILTGDEKYVVLFERWGVRLIDTDQDTSHKKDVDVPINTSCGLLGRNDKDGIIVHGYLRQFVTKYKMIIPIELYGIIDAYHCSNMVYLANEETQYFCKIPLESVM